MLTVEYRINGQLIGFTNIHNVCSEHKNTTDHECIYEYTHRPEDISKLAAGCVWHRQEDGFEALVEKVMKEVTKQGQSAETA